MQHRFRIATALTALGAVIIPPPQLNAQVPGAVYTVVVPSSQFGSQAFLNVVVGSIASAKKFCSEIGDTAYRVDCLAERLSVVAKGIPKDSDYGDVSAALKETSDKLAKLARSNRDSSRGRSYVSRGNTDERTSRPLTPIAAAAAASVNRQAIAILENTETVLLRSAESSKEKQNQYAQIAEAIGSNKVLLRA